MGIKLIGDRISFEKSNERLTVIISPAIERWQEGLILIWLMAWVAVEVVFVTTYFQSTQEDIKIWIIVFSSFWAYFFMKILKAFFWRKKGKEFLKIESDVLTLKKGVGKFGKAIPYFLNNIDEIELYEEDTRSFLSVMNNSFWVKGIDKLSFTYSGKRIVFGKQLTNEDARVLSRLLNATIKEHLKKEKKVS